MIEGVIASKGVGIGRAVIIDHHRQQYASLHFDVQEEIRIFREVYEKTKEHANYMRKNSKKKSEEETRAFSHFFKTERYAKEIEGIIRTERLNIKAAIEIYILEAINIERRERFKGYQFRIGILEALLECFLSNIEKVTAVNISNLPGKSIIIADELSIEEINQIDENLVYGLVTEKSGTTSHATLVAKMLGIPMLVGAKGACEAIKDSNVVIVDGESGHVYCNPSIDVLKLYMAKRRKNEELDSVYEHYINRETRTSDGHVFKIMANVSSPEEVVKAVEDGAEGVGLFRTEITFLRMNKMLSEEEQFNIYKKVMEVAGERPVTMRTMDIGGDKQFNHKGHIKEENPILGVRGIRFSLINPQILICQLLALYRASAFGNMKILFPMISKVEEVHKILKAIEVVKRILDDRGQDYGKPLIGIMVEVPAVALLIKDFLDEVDFICIGTNDLFQYMLAIDRGNDYISYLYDENSTETKKVIQYIVRKVCNNAKQKGIPVSICGDMATNSELVPEFLKLGVSEISVPSRYIGEMRWVINNLELGNV